MKQTMSLDLTALHCMHTSYSPSLHQAFYSSLLSNNAQGMRTVLDQVAWTEEASVEMETLLSTKLTAFCFDSKVMCTCNLVLYSMHARYKCMCKYKVYMSVNYA